MQNRFFIVILFTCSFFSAICADDSSFLSRQNDKIQYGLLLAQAQKSAQQTGIIGKKYDVRTSPAQLYKVPHSRLSPEEVVIKRCIAFVLHDFSFFAQCIAEPGASKWRNKKLSQDHTAYRERMQQRNIYSYWVHSSKIEGDIAKVIVGEKLGSDSTMYYKYDLKKSTGGWIIEREYGQKGNEWVLMGGW